jgi:hypothetical protein
VFCVLAQFLRSNLREIEMCAGCVSRMLTIALFRRRSRSSYGGSGQSIFYLQHDVPVCAVCPPQCQCESLLCIWMQIEVMVGGDESVAFLIGSVQIVTRMIKNTPVACCSQCIAQWILQLNSLARWALFHDPSALVGVHSTTSNRPSRANCCQTTHSHLLVRFDGSNRAIEIRAAVLMAGEEKNTRTSFVLRVGLVGQSIRL